MGASGYSFMNFRTPPCALTCTVPGESDQGQCRPTHSTLHAHFSRDLAEGQQMTDKVIPDAFMPANMTSLQSAIASSVKYQRSLARLKCGFAYFFLC